LRSYDIAVIGAGIAGTMVAYEAKNRGLSVVIIDRASKVATGGSGAAGAFISPKLGKETKLLKLTNLAYSYAVNFYKNNFNQYFDDSSIIRLPKDSEDAKNFSYYKSIIDEPSKILSTQELSNLGIKNADTALYFKNGGICDAQGLCAALAKDIDYIQAEVKSLNKLPVNAKKVVLATGYEGFRELLEYMGINGVWGSRGDFYTDTKVDISMHKSISISASKSGIVKLGATHTRAKNPTNACMQCNGTPLDSLIKESATMLNLTNLKLKETLCGMRAGSRDYIPLVGKVIDTNYMLNTYPQLKKGYNRAPNRYIDNLYILNGLGGRGFVLAPLMAKWLVDLIAKNKDIEPTVNPDRLFLKWARKLD
jgi:tRNA 5-methylaminomethyl-2-thiouridine biosynthesis bifunctional protein